jgi:cell division septation protein DedD
MIPEKKENEGKIVELPAEDETTATAETAATTAETTATVIEEVKPATDTATTVAATETAAPTAPVTPAIAQLLSTSDQKVAEGLAARVIERGFTSAYVERGTTDKGPVFRVRVKFPSEAEARAAEPRLREFSKEVWITAR